MSALRAGLARAGYAVDTATSGAEALEKLSVTAYDLMLLDLSLPDADGFQLTRRIRSEPPSGAKVSPDRRPPRVSSLARVTLNASTRVDGSDRLVLVPS